MIKDIVVYLDGSAEDEVRLSFAEALARPFDAHLTGLQAVVMPDVAIAGDAGTGAVQAIVDMQEKARADGAAKSALLEPRMQRSGLSAELRPLVVLANEAGQRVAAEARLADVFVATRPYGYKGGESALDTIETVLFNSGRSCLFVPPAGTPPANYDTVLLAWRNSREAARAVAEALPILKKAKLVAVAIVDESGPSEEARREPGADIAKHLDRHGVTVEIHHIAEWRKVSDALMNEAKAVGADLIVMGGYGHSRFREWVLGGATRDILKSADVPVLVAH